MATLAHPKNHKTHKKAHLTQLSVDFPRQNEVIASSEYTFRISAPADVQKVEVTIDHGPWHHCRQAAGFWWCDWSGYDDGEHEVTARLVTGDGRTVSAEPHEFFVRLEPKPL